MRISIHIIALLVLSQTSISAKDKANDTVTIISIPPGAQVEWNRKAVGVTPLTFKVGEYAFNVQKSSLFSKHLSAPVELRVSMEGCIAKQVEVTKRYVWRSYNGENAYAYFILTSNHYEINLDKISAKPAALSNADVIKLHAAGFSDELIVDKIANTPSAFNLELDDLVALRKEGLSDAVIQAMMHAR